MHVGAHERSQLKQGLPQEAAYEYRRLAGLLARVRGHISHRSLERVSPLAVPVLLEVGKESVYGAAVEDLLEEQADDLIAEAMATSGTGQLPL